MGAHWYIIRQVSSATGKYIHILGHQTIAMLLYLLLALVCYPRCIESRPEISRDAESPFTATVVLRTLAELNEEVGLTASEANILRRIAYTEAQRGQLEEEHNSSGGGIWAVDRSLFYRTQLSEVNPFIVSRRIIIRERLDIVWESVKWSDLADPLYSATAALLVILLAPTPSPPSSDVIGQAVFWVTHYRTEGSPEDFIRAVHRFEGMYNITNICMM